LFLNSLFYLINFFTAKQGFIIEFLPRHTHSELLLVYLFHFSLSWSYIFTYPAAQAGCPSLLMLILIKNSDKKGLEQEQIFDFFKDTNLCEDRINDLIDDNFIKNDGHKLIITKSGHFILNIFKFLRKLYGLPTGKG